MTPTVLVVGSYPPIPVPGAGASLEEVRRAWAAGHEVTVAAPRLCASQLVVPVAGLLAGRRLRNLRRVTGIDRLVLVVEDGYPFTRGDLLHQALTAALLLPALRSFGHVRLVRAGQPGVHPAVWGRLQTAADETGSYDRGPAAEGVTPLGPPEQPPSERARAALRTGTARLLGPRAPAVRSRLAALRRAAPGRRRPR